MPQLAPVVEHHQVLADVVDVLADHSAARVVVEPEDLPRLALEHQRAARRRADDVDAVAADGASRRAGAARSAAPARHAVGLQRQPADDWRADVDLAAHVLEQLDRPLARVRSYQFAPQPWK